MVNAVERHISYLVTVALKGSDTTIRFTLPWTTEVDRRHSKERLHDASMYNDWKEEPETISIDVSSRKSYLVRQNDILYVSIDKVYGLVDPNEYEEENNKYVGSLV